MSLIDKIYSEDKRDCPLTLLCLVIIFFLVFLAGVQLGIDRGRDLAVREAKMQAPEYKIQESEVKTPNPEPQTLTPVTIYAYAPVSRCTDRTPHTTASMQHVRPGIIAVSRDIEADLGLRFGDRVQIEGLGTFDFQDRMNARHVRSVDVFMPTVRECKAFGKRSGVLVARRGAVVAPSSGMVAER